MRAIAAAAHTDRAGTVVLDPWPFRDELVATEVEARPLPPSGRLADAGAMRAWLGAPERHALRCSLVPPGR